MKLDRLLSIIILLLNKDRASARELAERFEVTERTIYRDRRNTWMSGSVSMRLASLKSRNGSRRMSSGRRMTGERS